MDILSQYYSTLENLENLLTSLKSVSFIKRDFQRIECIEDEIRDVWCAITSMEKGKSGKCGYRPRGYTLKHCADLFVAMSKE